MRKAVVAVVVVVVGINDWPNEKCGFPDLLEKID